MVLFLQELNIAKPDDPERFVMEDGLTELLDGIYRYGVQVVNLSMFRRGGESFTPEMLLAVLKACGLRAEECLMLAATDDALALADSVGMASVGYDSPAIPGQRLERAQIVIEGFAEVDYYFLERMYQRKHGIPWTVVETERCFLREMEPGDLDALYLLYGEGDVARFVDPLYEDREEEEAFIRSYIMNMYRFYGYGMWLAFLRDTGELVGRAGLNRREIGGVPVLEMGYLIGAGRQRQGYATEICQGILQYAKGATDFTEISCFIQAENIASIGLALKLGFSWREEAKLDGKIMQRYVRDL